MRNSKAAAWLAGALILGSVACGGSGDGKYAVIKNLMSEQVKIFEKTTSALNKADNAEEVAAAIDLWSEGVAALLPKLKEHAQVLSELKEMETPLELQAVNTQLERVTREMSEAGAKIQTYMDDPKVQAAQKKLAEVLEEIDKT